MVSQTPTEINWNYLKWSVVLGPGSSSSGLYFARLRACLSFCPCYREFIAISLYSSWGGNATRSNFLFVQSSIPLFDSSQYLRAYYFSTFQLQVGRDYHKLRPLPSFLNFQLLFLQARGLLIYVKWAFFPLYYAIRAPKQGLSNHCKEVIRSTIYVDCVIQDLIFVWGYCNSTSSRCCRFNI